VNSNSHAGVLIESRYLIFSNNIVSGNTIRWNGCGVYLFDEDLTVIKGNFITDNTWGAYPVSSSDNTIYNNFFNNTNNFYFDGTIYNNTWNTTKTPGTNVISGPTLGGNFWATPDGTGFSENCTDVDGDGICDYNYTLASGNVDHLPLVTTTTTTTIPATIDIDPDTLNLKSNGEWITAYIELPEGYNVSDINVSTVNLVTPGGTVSVDLNAPATVGDYDLDGAPDLMVKFDRLTVVSYLSTTDVDDDGTGTDYEVVLTIMGELTDGTSFEGTDTIRVIDKGKKK